MFLMDAWYVAAWANEIGERPVGRTLLDEPVVLFRGTDGAIHALEDRCCHRAMPLSLGEVQGNDIRCEYHGMVFNGEGQCVAIPGQSTIPATAKVRSFPVVEKDDIVWIWMGDPDKADLSTIVSYPFHKTWPYKSKTQHLACNYLLLSDNLLDQTHGAFVHKSTLASEPDAYATAAMDTAPTDRGVKFTRWMLNCMPPGIYARAVPFQGRVDRWQEFEYVAPACILQFTGALDVGKGAYDKGVREGGFGLRIFYGMTPETEHTSWFFWSAANGYRQNDPAATEGLFQEIDAAFKEDDVVVEAQYAMMRRVGDRPLINIASDAARIHARHALVKAIANERGIGRDSVVITP